MSDDCGPWGSASDSFRKSHDDAWKSPTNANPKTGTWRPSNKAEIDMVIQHQAAAFIDMISRLDAMIEQNRKIIGDRKATGLSHENVDQMFSIIDQMGHAKRVLQGRYVTPED